MLFLEVHGLSQLVVQKLDKAIEQTTLRARAALDEHSVSAILHLAHGLPEFKRLWNGAYKQAFSYRIPIKVDAPNGACVM